MANTAVQIAERTTALHATEPSVPPRLTFPLPQELIDIIFEYLFDPAAVPYAPYSAQNTVFDHCNNNSGTAPTYRLSGMGIFMANRTLGVDAAQHFFRTTALIRVTFDCYDFQYHLQALGIPVVSDRRCIDQVNHHSFEVYISGHFLDLPLSKLPPSRVEASVLMLERDQVKLWNFVRYLSQHAQSDSPRVHSDRGQPLDVRLHSRTPTTFACKIYAKQKGYGAPNRKRQLRFLKSAAVVTGHLHRHPDDGFDGDAKVSTHMDSTPSPIWPVALEWDRFEMMLQFKTGADDLALTENFKPAAIRYRYLSKVVSRKIQTLSLDHRAPRSVDWRYLLLLLDLDVSYAWLCLREGEFNWAKMGFRSLTDALKRYPDSLFVIDSSLSSFSHICRIVRLLDLRHSGSLTWSHDLQELKGLPRTDARNHDIAVIERALSSNWASTALTHKDFSVFTMPFQPFDSQLDCNPIIKTRPANLKGWQDVQHLAEFTEDERAMVRELSLGLDESSV